MNIEAPKASEFCNILAAARQHKLQGWWDGSAFRDHPCGVIRKGIIFANQWSTFDYCYAAVILDPTSKIIPGQQESCSHGNPYPKPDKGGSLQVYWTGSWSNDDGPWRAIILSVLEELKAEIADAEAKVKARLEAEAIAAKKAKNDLVAKAIEALSLQPSA